MQAAADGVDIPKPRRRRSKPEEHPVDVSVQTRRKSSKVADKLFKDVHEEVYDTAMNLAGQNWRRLEVIDSTTVVVHNNEVH
ncbi:hypothetical protein SEA_BILLNYE_109 [Streptomyces phage BillNye]|uniref:Uncharacterized protein n=2 Tax=Wilnyevirus billnye TaxID=2560486 RepID=A0A2L1IVV8_9CAUD|nr:hypothetical protein FDJ30_gp136 [Streptomyces phage BillNye]AVD99297.1 hypothetical protein SEA_BILLNYE_109 [Streptomyces phage BillNye]QBZ72380.1 hypothetical protein SEA_CIRCINUS_110 [Streptomyces phage Circinus]